MEEIDKKAIIVAELRNMLSFADKEIFEVDNNKEALLIGNVFMKYINKRLDEIETESLPKTL